MNDHREQINAAQKARVFFGPRRGAGCREQGPRVKHSSIQQLKLRTRCARCRKLALGPRRESTTTQRRKVRSTCIEIGEKLKRVHRVAGHTERRLFFLGATWTFVEVLWDTGAVDFSYTPELHIAFCPIFVHPFEEDALNPFSRFTSFFVQSSTFQLFLSIF